VKPSIAVVGIGASAGGLEALESFFDNMEHEFPGLGAKRLRLGGRRMHQKDLGFNNILLAIEDVTEKNSNP
jgi:hypothetical protein